MGCIMLLAGSSRTIQTSQARLPSSSFLHDSRDFIHHQNPVMGKNPWKYLLTPKSPVGLL